MEFRRTAVCVQSVSTMKNDELKMKHLVPITIGPTDPARTALLHDVFG